jgi:hypothetical protein
MEAMKDGRHLYDVERRAEHAARPGFRISELQISPTQQVPWHFHSDVQDTFYVLGGILKPRRPHRVTNGGEGSARWWAFFKRSLPRVEAEASEYVFGPLFSQEPPGKPRGVT